MNQGDCRSTCRSGFSRDLKFCQSQQSRLKPLPQDHSHRTTPLWITAGAPFIQADIVDLHVLGILGKIECHPRPEVCRGNRERMDEVPVRR